MEGLKKNNKMDGFIQHSCDPSHPYFFEAFPFEGRFNNMLNCEKNSCSKTSTVNVSNQRGGLVKTIVEKFGNNSTCSNLPFVNFERAKIQPGLVKKEVNQSRKLGQN